MEQGGEGLDWRRYVMRFQIQVCEEDVSVAVLLVLLLGSFCSLERRGNREETSIADRGQTVQRHHRMHF